MRGSSASTRPIKVLIIGGGMAGWTLAGALVRRQITPVLVERVPEYTRVGFWIGLYPFSANTLRETGIYERYVSGSLAMDTYSMRDRRGRLLQEMSFASVLGRINGEMRALERTDLLALLVDAATGTDVRMGTTATLVEPRDTAANRDRVAVSIGDAPAEEFDLVVAADGVHSATRAALLSDASAGVRDWGYTAFTWWVPASGGEIGAIDEYWGPGGLFGMYPLGDKTNAIAGMPTPAGLDTMDADGIARVVNDHFGDYPEPVRTALAQIGRPGSPTERSDAAAIDQRVYPWPMVDQRAKDWIHGRVALLGDAACAFLPTAGVGASNAMKSAAVLADELGRAEARTIPQALDLWQQRVRRRVEANQDNSRTLARMMFVKGPRITKARDVLLRRYPVEKVAADVLKSNITPW